MLYLTTILGHADEPALAARLHELAHHGTLETLHVPPQDVARHRLRLHTDAGTECAIALPRELALGDGAVLLLEADRAVIVRLGRQHWLRLRARSSAAALELGYQAGNLHWKVRFEAGDLLVARDGPVASYLDRLAPLLDAGAIEVVATEDAG